MDRYKRHGQLAFHRADIRRHENKRLDAILYMGRRGGLWSDKEGEIMTEAIGMALIIVATFAGIAATIVGAFLGITLIKKRWPDVWD